MLTADSIRSDDAVTKFAVSLHHISLQLRYVKTCKSHRLWEGLHWTEAHERQSLDCNANTHKLIFHKFSLFY